MGEDVAAPLLVLGEGSSKGALGAATIDLNLVEAHEGKAVLPHPP